MGSEDEAMGRVQGEVSHLSNSEDGARGMGGVCWAQGGQHRFGSGEARGLCPYDPMTLCCIILRTIL